MEGGGGAAMEVLVQNLIDVTKGEISLIRGLKKNAEKLQNSLSLIQSYLDDAEKKLITEEAVKTWLKQLDDAAFDAHNVLDELNYHLLSKKMKSIRREKKKKVLPSCFPSCNGYIRRRNMALKINKIYVRFESLLNIAKSLDLHSQPAIAHALPPITHSFTVDPIFIGRDKDVKHIVDLMLTRRTTEQTFFVLPIVGMGGLVPSHHHLSDTASNAQFGAKNLHTSFHPLNSAKAESFSQSGSGFSITPRNFADFNRNGLGFWRAHNLVGGVRSFSSESVSRECLNYDVVIVGAGPAGLSAAIKLKQLCKEKDVDLSVCVVEKGAEVGAHILSGNVFEPRALDELLPNWKQEEAPIHVPVSSDKFWLLSKTRALPLPSPFNNRGNYVISLSQLVRWLGMKAEELGVEIYPGFAASEVLYDTTDKVVGIATNDMGVAKDGSKKDIFQPGVELKGRVTLFAEGCRGSLSEKVIKKYNLREKGQGQHQTYALGIKEVWEITPDKHQAGYVLHTLGWPLDPKTYGGSFLYHMKDRQVAIGFVVALNYSNPFLNPYEEFQKFKHHPAISPLLEGGTVLEYGARTLNEGGYQSIPYPVFPGGAIIGCSAGFLNVPKIKGSHTAMKSGMLAAESVFQTLHEGSPLEALWDSLKSSWIWKELHGARNYRPAFDYGLLPGLALSGLEHYVMKGRSPWTLKHGKPDHEATEEARLWKPIDYPKPDGFISFDVPTSLYRSNTNHDHDQPAHLRLRDPKMPELVNLPMYAGPESRYCPARVYEYMADENGNPKLQISAQNCLHCKACDIKDPKQNIEWTVPEGGGGPSYTVM